MSTKKKELPVLDVYVGYRNMIIHQLSHSLTVWRRIVDSDNLVISMGSLRLLTPAMVYGAHCNLLAEGE